MLSKNQLLALNAGVDIRQEIKTSGNYTYVGTAPKGALSSEDKWKIKRIYQTDTATSITWSEADQVFDDCEGVSYS